MPISLISSMSPVSILKPFDKSDVMEYEYKSKKIQQFFVENLKKTF